MTIFAREIDGCPTVTSALERGARFPLPKAGQKVHNLDTGGVERYDGTGWIPIGAEVVSVADKGGKGDGTTMNTTAVTAAIAAAAGKVLYFGKGAWKMAPVTVNVACTIVFAPGATVVPVFDAGSTEKLFNVTADGVRIIDIAIADVAGTISGNKYLVYGDGSDRLQVIRPRFTDISMSDGNTGLTNLIVVHCVYATDAADVKVEDIQANFISGSAVFGRNLARPRVVGGHITDTRWYSINFDSGCTDFEIGPIVIDGDDPLSRYWGGSVNLMSQIGGSKNKRGTLRKVICRGKHNYGAVFRTLSAEDIEFIGCIADSCTPGTVSGASQDLFYFAIDRRGTAEGEPENGPCINITYDHCTAIAGEVTGSRRLFAFTFHNQFKATRDPHKNIRQIKCEARSSDSTHYFEEITRVHGHKCGVDGVFIDVQATVKTALGGFGAIGVVSTNSDGKCVGVHVSDETRVSDIFSGDHASTDTFRVGFFAQATAEDLHLGAAAFDNFRYGARTASSGITNLFGLHRLRFTRCLEDTLYSTLETGGGFRVFKGAALPTSALYQVNDVWVLSAPAASSVNAYRCITAGGAVTGAWASGATYAVPMWRRNASNRVYELITAGGGTTSVEPTHTTVGQDVTGADGYKWRCRSTVPVRWAGLAADGALVALP